MTPFLTFTYSTIMFFTFGPVLTRSSIMFNLDQFAADCRTAIAQDPWHKFVREVVARGFRPRCCA
jgi:hypothetical protein